MITSKRDFKIGGNLYYYGKKRIIYCRFRVKGKEIRRSTGKKDIPLAQSVAWDIYQEAAGIKDAPAVELRRSTYPLLSEIGKVYKEEIPKYGKCAPGTARNNFNKLLGILRLVELENPRLDKISPSTITQWRTLCYERKRKRLAKERGIDDSSDNGELRFKFGENEDLELNYTLNSIFRQAKSVFSRNALRMYEAKGLKIPQNIIDFCSTGFLKQMSTNFVPIPQETDDKIKLACEMSLTNAGDNERRNAGIDNIIPPKSVAVAVELARYCGLTVKEIVGIRWEWFEGTKDAPVISIRYRPAAGDVPAWGSKGDKKNGIIPVRPERLARWRKALCAEKKKHGYVFDFASDTKRKDFVERTVSQWVAQFLPDREKKLHELRKQAGSEVATKEGIYAAARFLRDTVIVAERHYASLLKQVSAL